MAKVATAVLSDDDETKKWMGNSGWSVLQKSDGRIVIKLNERVTAAAAEEEALL